MQWSNYIGHQPRCIPLGAAVIESSKQSGESIIKHPSCLSEPCQTLAKWLTTLLMFCPACERMQHGCNSSCWSRFFWSIMPADLKQQQSNYEPNTRFPSRSRHWRPSWRFSKQFAREVPRRPSSPERVKLRLEGPNQQHAHSPQMSPDQKDQVPKSIRQGNKKSSAAWSFRTQLSTLWQWKGKRWSQVWQQLLSELRKNAVKGQLQKRKYDVASTVAVPFWYRKARNTAAAFRLRTRLSTTWQ